MKKMRFLSLAVAVVLCAGFVSCGDDEPDEPQNLATENTGGASENGGNSGGTIELVGAVADAVDLGLPSGTLWASWNVGATAPEGAGGYYAWGETVEKSNYDYDTYKYRGCSFTKYCTDNKTTLEPEDDVAHMMWGDGWRMPTYVALSELNNTSYCTWTWTTLNGVNGYRITSNSNGNSIFLPAADLRSGTLLGGAGNFGRYWSSKLAHGYDNHAYVLDFGSDEHSAGFNPYTCCRWYGRSVRPVKEK